MLLLSVHFLKAKVFFVKQNVFLNYMYTYLKKLSINGVIHTKRQVISTYFLNIVMSSAKIRLTLYAQGACSDRCVCPNYGNFYVPELSETFPGEFD